jgi:hypothetical protein
VHGLRGDTSIAERSRFDNLYIEHWSGWQDTKIFLQTIAAVLRDAVRSGDGAAASAWIDAEEQRVTAALTGIAEVSVDVDAGLDPAVEAEVQVDDAAAGPRLSIT